MVTIEELKETFAAVFGEELNISDISESSNLRKDIGMTSIHLIYMAMTLEEKYQVRFTNNDFESIATIGDVINKIQGGNN